MTKADLLVTAIIFFALCLPALLWTEPHNRERRQSALTLPLFVLLAVALELLAVLACKIRLPLRDADLGRIDSAMGFSVPVIVTWFSAHSWFNRASWSIYACLDWLVRFAVFVPALLGKRENAWRFLLANVLAIATCAAFFLLFPAIGPWVLHGFPASEGQKACEAAILAARDGRQPVSPILICFPSFHVIWAILSVDALWFFRRARVPLAIFSGLIVLSTLTTGWHYAADVAAGLAIALVALIASRHLLHLKTASPIGSFAAAYTAKTV